MKGIAPYLLGADDQNIIDDLNNQSNPQQVLEWCLDNIVTFSPFGVYKYGGIIIPG